MLSLTAIHNYVLILVPTCSFGAATYVPALTLEKPIYARERNDGLYRPITYLLAKMFDEIVITGTASLLSAAFVFHVVELQGHFLLFWLAYFVTLSTGIVLAYVVATLSPNMDIANAALPTYVVCPHLPMSVVDKSYFDRQNWNCFIFNGLCIFLYAMCSRIPTMPACRL